MASDCSDVSPARLVERAEAPAGPMPFELRGRTGAGARKRDGAGAYVNI